MAQIKRMQLKVGSHKLQIIVIPKRPTWANCILAFNVGNLQCNYPCGNLVKDNTWFSIRKENGHYFIFHSENCREMFDRRHKREKLMNP